MERKFWDKREQGTTVGTEEAAETKMNSCRGTIQNIGPQILCSHGDYFGIMGENAQNIRRNKLKRILTSSPKETAMVSPQPRVFFARSGLPAPTFCAAMAEMEESMAEGTRKEKR